MTMTRGVKRDTLLVIQYNEKNKTSQHKAMSLLLPNRDDQNALWSY